MMALVTGATGFAGQHLVQRLLDRGVTVRILTRNLAHMPAIWRGRVEAIVGDVSHRSDLYTTVKGVDIVYHLAGEVRDKNRFDVVNHVGTENLLESCTRTGSIRFLHCSSVGVIGATQRGKYDEQSPCRPTNAYEQSKLLAERAVLQYYRDGKLAVTIVRPTIMFGPRPKGADDSFLSWIKAIKSSRFRFIGSDDAIANYVYVEDVAEMCIHLAEDERAVGQIFHIADPSTIREFVGWATRLLDVPMPGYLPAWAAHTLAFGLTRIGKVGRFAPPLTITRIRALTSQAVFSGDKLRRDYDLPVGWHGGLRRTISAYRDMGELL